MSLDTRTERRQARQRRALVIGAVVALASVLSVALIVAFLTGTDQSPSADGTQNASTSGWTPTGDDVWSDAASPTSVPTSTLSSTTPATGTPAVGATGGASTGTAVTVARTAGAPQPSDSSNPKSTATASTTTEVPPGQLKRPKPKNTTPPPRR